MLLELLTHFGVAVSVKLPGAGAEVTAAGVFADIVHVGAQKF